MRLLETPEVPGRPDSKPRPFHCPLSPGTGGGSERTQTCIQGQPFPWLSPGCPSSSFPRTCTAMRPACAIGQLLSMYREQAEARPGLHCDFAPLHICSPSSHPKSGAQQLLQTLCWIHIGCLRKPRPQPLLCPPPSKSFIFQRPLKGHITRYWVSKSTGVL